jgi:hypothetical protein
MSAFHVKRKGFIQTLVRYGPLALAALAVLELVSGRPAGPVRLGLIGSLYLLFLWWVLH